MSRWLQDNSWDELAGLRDEAGGVIIIPVGSTEQHGSHLPLGTDTMVAMMLAEDGAEQAGVVVAPPLWFGWSPHHMVLPGTITIRPEILIEVLYDVIDSLHRHGFAKFVVINGHRIVNIPWMQLAAERAQRLLGVKVVLFDPAYMSKTVVAALDYGPVGHSEEIETSHMLYKHPELVQLAKARDNPPPRHELYSVDPAYPGDTLCYVPSTVNDMQRSVDAAGGTTGSPSKTGRDQGRIYHEHLVKNLVAVIRQLQG
ncbi:MAG: creatininase family protein [Negativicutes bacterium]|nr:creatininase family protein [Negativicutes bacterium]